MQKFLHTFNWMSLIQQNQTCKFQKVILMLLCLLISATSDAQVSMLGTVTQVTQTNTIASFTVPAGNNRMLFVTASDAFATNITGVSFGGSSLFERAERNDGVAVDAFYTISLGSSAVSTIASIVISSSNTTTNAAKTITARVFQNVDQTTNLNSIQTNQNTTVPSASNLTVVSNPGDLVIDLFDTYRTTSGGSGQVQGSGQTITSSTGAVNFGTGSDFGFYSTSTKAGASSVSMSWSTSDHQALLHLAANIKQAACTNPSAPTITQGTTSTSCAGTSTTLSIGSGSLNSATNWQWYSGSCGGVSVGSGNSISPLAATTTTYYVRGEGGCVTPGTCASVTISVSLPEINVQGNSVNIPDGSTTPISSNHTDFGNVTVGSIASRSFTIQNLGNNPLTVSNISSSNSLFTVGALSPASPVPAGSTASFVVSILPTSTGVKTTTINIDNNDCDHGVYNFDLKATSQQAITSLSLSGPNSASLASVTTFTATLLRVSAPTGPLSGQLVSFTIVNPSGSLQVLSSITNSAGEASISFISSMVGVHTVQASFAGSPNFSAAISTTLQFTVTAPCIAPTVTCPASITLNPILNACDATYTYSTSSTGTPAPTITYAMSGATSISGSGNGSGTTFALGTTTVKIYATNTCGVDSCTFNVTVNDTQNPSISCSSNISTSTGFTPVAYYPFNTNLNDITNNYGVALLTGNSTPPSSPSVGNPLCLNGIYLGNANGQNMITPNLSSLNATNFKLNVDFKLNGYPGANGFPVIMGGDAYRWIGVYVNADGKAGIKYNNSIKVFSTTTLNLNQWYSASITYTNNTITLSIDNSVVFVQNAGPLVTGNNYKFTTSDFSVGMSLNGCVRNLQLFNGATTCGSIVYYSAPIGIDNCPGATTVQATGLASGANFPVGVTTNKFIVTDASGNKDSCSFTVTVNDTQKPTISCPGNISVNNDNTLCGAVVNFTAPVGTDNCAGATTLQTQGLASGSTFPIGVTTNKFVVTDASGNQDSCSFTVTVNDTQIPTLLAPSNQSLNVNITNCNATYTIVDPISDNCSGSTWTYNLSGASTGTATLNDGSNAIDVSFNTGSTLVTLSGVDASANQAISVTFIVDVIDGRIPVITCPTTISQHVDAGQCNAVVNYALPTVSNNCVLASPILMSGGASGSAFPIGSSQVTYALPYTAATYNFNTLTVGANISGQDGWLGLGVGVPNNTMLVNNATPYVNPQNSGPGLLATFIGANKTSFATRKDNANFSIPDFDATGLMTIQFDARQTYWGNSLLFGYDVNNNGQISGSGEFSFGVRYSLVGGNITLLGAGGVVLGSAATNLYSLDGRWRQIKLSIDKNANSGSGSISLSFRDVVNNGPWINVPALQNLNAGFNPAAFDALNPMNINGMVYSHEAGDDANENSFLDNIIFTKYNFCSFNINIDDNEAPVAICNNINVELNASHTYTLTAAEIDNGSNDHCGAVTLGISAGQYQYTCANVGQTYPVVLTVTDANNNTSSCTANVTVHDNQHPCCVPVNINCPSNITVNNGTNMCGAIVNFAATATGTTPAYTYSHNANSIFPIGTTTVTAIATNACSVDSCHFTITVVDTTHPTLFCLPGYNVFANHSGCTYFTNNFANIFGTPSATDNCSGVVVTGPVPAGPYPVGTTVLTWTATDASNNVTTCTQNFTVVAATTSGSSTDVACDTYSWSGTTYTSTGMYTKTFANSLGCDSMHTLNLTIHQSNHPVDNISNFGCYTWAVNNQTYTLSGTYTSSYTNQFGCDSVHTLNLVITPGVKLAIKAILDGPYNSVNGLMTDSLRINLLIPSTEPYTATPYSKPAIGGPSGETVSSAVLGVSGNNAIVDWVYIELRDALNPSNIVASKRALIQRDGDIVSHVDGTSAVLFETVNNGNYYVTLKHRNHLGIMSASPLSLFGCSTTSIDFTNSDPVYTISSITGAPRKLNGTLYTLWSADANNNKNVKYNGLSSDKDKILNAVGVGTPNGTVSNVYRMEDVNLDGKIRYNNLDNDRIPVINNVGTNTPNNILNQHTPN